MSLVKQVITYHNFQVKLDLMNNSLIIYSPELDQLQEKYTNQEKELQKQYKV